MSTTTATETHAEHAEHHELSFIRKYIFSTDHKMIAKQFLFTALLFLLLGGLLAVTIRWQLGFPGRPLPAFIQWIFPDTMAPGGIILPEFYNSLVTMHATFMIFFALMPLMAGVFGNLLIPLQIGAEDMAFPRINMVSFWIMPVAGIIMLASFFVEGGAAGAGWTSYAPLSTSGEWTGVYMGQILWLVSLTVLGILLDPGRFELRLDRDQHAGAGDDMVPDPPGHVVAVHHRVVASAGDPDPHGRPDSAPLRSDARNGLLPPRGQRRATPLAAHLLVLRAPGGVHPDPSRDGLRLRSDRMPVPEADLRLPLHGDRAGVHRVPVMGRLGPPHVPERHEPTPRHDLRADDGRDRGPLCDQGIQLDRNALAREHPLRRAAPARGRVRVALHHRRPVGNVHGRGCRRHLHPRPRTSSWRTSTTFWWVEVSSEFSRESSSGIPRCSAG